MFAAVALLLSLFSIAGIAVAEDAAKARTETASSQFQSANAAFEKAEYADALAGYERLANSGYATAAVLGNAASAAYRLGDTGRAVLNYRRALRADPTYDRALSSLKIVSPATNHSTSPLAAFVEAVFSHTSPMMWFLLADLFIIAGSFSMWRAMRAELRDDRGHWIMLMGYAFFIALVCGGVGAGDYHWRVGGNEAVVLADDTRALSGPTEKSAELLALPAGTVVTIIEEPSRGYVRARLFDGSTGYVPVGAIERI